jgi:hypothetical protein
VPPIAPGNCRHPATERAEVIMDGRGNVIGYHRRCTECHIIITTEML